MRTQLKKIVFTAALGLALAFIFSCSSGGDNGSNEPGGGPSSPSGGLVNADNEAWLKDIDPDDDGVIFKQNGEWVNVDKKNENWCIKNKVGTYSISGNQITMCSNRCYVASFSISGNKLTLTRDSETSLYTKTSINIVGNCSD